MIIYKKGDLFNEKTEAIVNTVNTVGVMGKGIALQFKKRFPENYKKYKLACDKNSVVIGKMFITESDNLFNKYVINFPTKSHWRKNSKYEYIVEGLDDLIKEIKKREIKSIALPPLGAGNGGLDWNTVRQLIEKKLSDLPEVSFIIFEPQVKFKELDNIKLAKSNLTPIRAMLLDVFQDYNQFDEELNLLVAQKIAYFLQRSGQPLNIKFEKGWYGPYSSTLIKVLQTMNGSFIKYNSESIKPENQITLIESSRLLVEKELRSLSSKQKSILKNIKEFIDGFKTPFSLELLATVDYLRIIYPEKSINEIHAEIEKWTNRKANLIKYYHVKVAFDHLKENKHILKG